MLAVLAIAALLAALYAWTDTLPRRRARVGPPPLDDHARAFPADFLLGTATSDHQIEHQQRDDWTAFEEAARAAGRGGRTTPGRPLAGHVHGVDTVAREVLTKKADWDARFDRDLDLMKSMGIGAHRFSLSWARLFPDDTPEPDPAGVAFYDRVIDAHLVRGIVPFVTLHHFAQPQWFSAAGGFEAPGAAAAFDRYVRAVAARFGDRVTRWCTFNEPMVYVYLGYMDGLFPPGQRRRDPRSVVPIMAALLRAHAAAYTVLHDDATARGKTCEVGLAHHFRVFEPMRDWAPLDRFATAMVQRSFLWAFTDALHTGVLRPPLGPRVSVPEARGTQDYFGLNYYGVFYVQTDAFAPLGFDIVPSDPRVDDLVSDLGWASDAEGFRLVMHDVARRYGLPIQVLENGIADADVDDRRRRRFIVEHLRELLRTIDEGVDVRGYFHWSFLDNFEWAEGFSPRFGLVKVDYDDGFARSVRGGGRLYQQVCEARALASSVEGES